MPGTPTTKYGIETMAGSDIGSTIDDTHNAAVATIDSKMVGYSAGLLAARPVSTGGSPGIAGRRYRATDTGQEFIDHGTGWVEIAQAPVADASLASPNNAVWRTIRAVRSHMIGGQAIGTYALVPSAQAVLPTSGMEKVALWVPDSAEVAVAGKTARVRLVAVLARNGTAPAMTFSVALRSATLGGGAGVMSYTLGGIPASPVSFVSPGASGTTRAEGATVDLADLVGAAWTFAVTTTVAALAANSVVGIDAYLQLRHT